MSKSRVAISKSGVAFLKERNSKYNAKKVTVDGITFASISESKRYPYLKMRLRAHEIKDLELQKKYLLQEAFTKNGKRYRKIEYVADFCYYDLKKDKYIVEDVKGVETKVFKIKKKLFEMRYPGLEITEVK